MACEEGGYDCELVDKPPKEVQTECPVCLLVLKEPNQVSCCGYAFCKMCIEKIKRCNQPCPCCMGEVFNHFHDKRLKRSLSGLKVSCSIDCPWVGELNDLDEHLNKNPTNEEQLKGCKHVKIECLYCAELIKRSEIETHQENCPKRPFSCDHCKDYDSTYEDVTTNHWSECNYYPLSCPNMCGQVIPRQNLKIHMDNNCPLTTIECEFKFAGCEERLPRKDMPAHLWDNTATHLSLQATYFRYGLHYNRNCISLW